MPRILIQTVWLISIVLVIWLSTIPGGAISPDVFGIDKIEHFTAYAWLSILPFTGFKKQSNAFIAIFLIFILGGLLELGQGHILGRTASTKDMIANSIGILMGIYPGLRTRRFYAGYLETE